MSAPSVPIGSQAPRVLVTGDQGFVGQHVSRCWPNVVGLSELLPGVDIRNRQALREALAGEHFDAVLHLAALSFVPDSFKNPAATFDVNFLGTLCLLEVLAETGFAGRFIHVGTGDAYGLVSSQALPITEDQPLRPRNPYAVSKVASEALCFQWSQTGPFEVLMVRPFNHIGAGQSPAFAIPDFARQLAEIAAGRRAPELSVGNIEVTRDFTDVQDIVGAYRHVLLQGRSGEIYNVCSGTERSVRALLQQLIAFSGCDVEVLVDAARYRPAEQQRVCGSHDKLTTHTGWYPTIPIEETLLKIYRYWEQEIGK